MQPARQKHVQTADGRRDEHDLGLADTLGRGDCGDRGDCCLAGRPGERLLHNVEPPKWNCHEEAEERRQDRKHHHLRGSEVVSDHGVGGEVVGDETKSTASRADRRDRGRFMTRRRLADNFEREHKQHCDDDRALLDDPHLEGEVRVDARHEHGEEKPGDNAPDRERLNYRGDVRNRSRFCRTRFVNQCEFAQVTPLPPWMGVL